MAAANCLYPTQETTPTVPDTNPKSARAIADGKLRLELIETALTHPVARVMAHGADKYGVRNWRTQPIYLRTYIGAMRRHVDAIADGEWLDPDSGEPHAAHVAACTQVILDARAHGTLNDDTDYAEGGVPGGVAANVPGGAKPDRVDCGGGILTYDMKAAHPGAEFVNFSWDCTTNPCEVSCCTDDEPVGAGVSRPQPLCAAFGGVCRVLGGCSTPCKDPA
ncbi:MAG: dATP/dGTP diphosphohydrolase domain-containing protein [Pseudomonadota bacterium]